MRQISGKACLAAMVIGFVCIWSCAASAMAAYVVDDQLILSGQVVDGDARKVAQALASSAITTVILRNSPGGDSVNGGQIAELLRQRGLRTAVSRFCYSVCGRMFLGGRTRQFTDDYAPEFCRISRILPGHHARPGERPAAGSARVVHPVQRRQGRSGADRSLA